MIATKSFRAAEQMLLAAKISNADALMTAIAVAIETMMPTPHCDEVGVPEPITLRLAVLAERLGWDDLRGVDRLREANEVILPNLDFTIGSCRVDGVDGDRPWFKEEAVAASRVEVTLSPTLESIVRGTAMIEIATDDPRAMIVDAGSSAMVALVARLAAAGGGCLYREAETADERVPELVAVAATIAAEPTLAKAVVVHDRTDRGRIAVPSTAALLAAVLHGIGVLVTTDEFVLSCKEIDERAAVDDDFDSLPLKAATAWCPLTASGARLAALLPYAPLAVIVPISRDITRAPNSAAAFVTAIGPLRRDRAAAAASLRAMAEGRMNDAVVDRFVDLWDGRAEHARTSLDTVGRMVADDASRRRPLGRAEASRTAHDALAAETYSGHGRSHGAWTGTSRVEPGGAAAEAESGAVLPRAVRMRAGCRLLFSERLRDERSVRILLVGPPGTGKSAAASHIASKVLGLPDFDLKASDVLFYRLGALERAIAAAFQQARERSAVLIIGEADSLVQDRATASPGSLHLVTAITNTMLIELDRHDLPVILATNYGDRLDAGVKRRLDLTFEVKPIPEELEVRALRLLLDFDPPNAFAGFGGDTVISDYAGAKRVLRLQGDGDGDGAEAAVAAVRRARDVRLGRKETRRIGF